MTHSFPLTLLAEYLAGKFENQAQAKAEPTWYVHLQVWQRPIDLFTDDSITFFLEQANVAAQTAPYRQRVLRLQSTPAGLSGRYYALASPQSFQGGGEDPRILRSLTPTALIDLPDCCLEIQIKPAGSIAVPLTAPSESPQASPDSYRFEARPKSLCSFEYQGQRKYVQLGFDIGPAPDGTLKLLSYEKGVDPETGRGLWGALMGPFCLLKTG